MENSTIILIVIAVVVVLVGVTVAVALSNRAKARRAQEEEQQRAQAAELRQDATAGTGLQQSEIEAREAKLEADRARLEAEQARARAEEVQHGHLQEQARTEEQLREADRIDPDVDTRADGYTPAPTHRDDVPPRV